MRGYRCQKSIYLTIHQPELEAKITPEQQALFDQGNAVGEEARKRFPGGVLVDNKPWDFVGSMKRTKELVDLKTNVIFEAAFSYQGCYARTDILQFNPENQRWKIFEVKSSTKVKDEQIDDAALQAWIFAKSGLLIDKIHIMYLNNQCRYPDLENLFITQEITDKVREIYPTILPKVTEIYQTLQNPVVPAVDIGEHCSEPNECGFKVHCWKEKNIPEFSIFDLPQIRGRKLDLYKKRILTLDDPRLTKLNSNQTKIVESFKNKKRFFIYPTYKMVESGAKAAYGKVMIDEDVWPNVNGSVPADTYRMAAFACFNAMMEMYNEEEEPK